MPNIYLYHVPSDTNPADVRLSDPTQLVSSSITGNLSATEANDSLSAAATVLITASLTVNEDVDVLVGAGTAGSITGSLTATESNDTLSASANIIVGASLSATEAADTLSATGSILISGTSAETEASDTLSASGTVLISASASLAELGDILSAIAASTIIGTSTNTEAGDSLSASGTVVGAPITANLSIIQENSNLSASANSSDQASIDDTHDGIWSEADYRKYQELLRKRRLDQERSIENELSSRKELRKSLQKAINGTPAVKTKAIEIAKEIGHVRVEKLSDEKFVSLIERLSNLEFHLGEAQQKLLNFRMPEKGFEIEDNDDDEIIELLGAIL